MIIYKILNLVNRKVYIGQTIGDPNYRPYFHLKNSHNKHLKAAIKKHGISNFIIEIIEYCDSVEQLDKREIYWIKYFDATNIKKGYNIDPGGRKNINRPKYQPPVLKIGRRGTKVDQINSSTWEIVHTYSSITEAAKSLNIPVACVSGACQLRQAYSYKFIWKYSSVPIEQWKKLHQDFITSKQTIKNKHLKRFLFQREILQKDIKTGKPIKTWLNDELKAKFSHKEVVFIRGAASGARKTAYGYRWEYQN